eukprot:6575991-Pyramimonas_sp.AAC.1
MAQCGSKMLQDRSTAVPNGHGTSQGGRRKVNHSKTSRKSMMVAFSPFRLTWPSEASRQLQEGP